MESDTEKELREEETVDDGVEIHTDPPEFEAAPWAQNTPQDDEETS